MDPAGQIFDTVTVGAGGSVTVRVPRNATRNGTTHTEHNRGYVIYGPATPQGTLTMVGSAIRSAGNTVRYTLTVVATGPMKSFS